MAVPCHFVFKMNLTSSSQHWAYYRVTEVSLAFKDPMHTNTGLKCSLVRQSLTLHYLQNVCVPSDAKFYALGLLTTSLLECFVRIFYPFMAQCRKFTTFLWHWALCVFWGVQDVATGDRQQTLAGYDINRWYHSGLIPPFTDPEISPG